MPQTRFLDRLPGAPRTSTVTGDHAPIGVDSTTNDLRLYSDSTATPQTYPKELFINLPLVAGSADGDLWIATDKYTVASVKHSVSVGASGATLILRKCSTTTAPASGTTLFTSTNSLDLNVTANTVTTATLSTVAGVNAFAAGDRLAADFSGTLTGLIGICTITLRRI